MPGVSIYQKALHRELESLGMSPENHERRMELLRLIHDERKGVEKRRVKRNVKQTSIERSKARVEANKQPVNLGFQLAQEAARKKADENKEQS